MVQPYQVILRVVAGILQLLCFIFAFYERHTEKAMICLAASAALLWWSL